MRHSLLAALLVSGCASYQPAPIRLDEHLQSWRSKPLPQGQLALAEATQLALTLNPQLRIARSKAGVAVADAGLAGRFSDPDLSTAVRRAMDTGDSPWVVSADIRFTIPLSGRLGAERAAARHAADASLEAARMAEEALAIELAEAWFAWSADVRRRVIVAQHLKMVAQLSTIADGLHRAGELSSERAAVLRLDVAQKRLEVDDAQAAAELKRRHLLALMGLAPNTPVELSPSFDAPAPPTPADDWAARSTTVRWRAARYDASEQTVRREIARQFPELSIGPSFEFDGRSWLGLGLGLSHLPLFDFNQKNIAIARAQRSLAGDELRAALQSVVAEADALTRRRTRAERRLAGLTTHEQLIAEQLTQLQTLAERGELDVLLLHQLLDRRVETALAIAKTQAELASATSALTILVGGAR